MVFFVCGFVGSSDHCVYARRPFLLGGLCRTSNRLALAVYARESGQRRRRRHNFGRKRRIRAWNMRLVYRRR
jgi:hypothetical protein